MIGAHIVGIDWGSSTFRAWLISSDGRVADALMSPRGILFAGPVDQRAWLTATLLPWISTVSVTEILGVGMIGSRSGISEAAYVAVPATADAWSDMRHRAGDIAGVPLWIYPGLSSFTASGDDVLRGEEFLAFSTLEGSGELDSSVIVCPGTHSKWMRNKGASITSFRTYVTGELFSLWSRHSSIASHMTDTQTSCGIELGLRMANLTDDVLGGLFPLRAGILAGHIADKDVSGVLSGLLVGREVLVALQWGGYPERVTLIADGPLLDVYSRALVACGVQPDIKPINLGSAFHALTIRGSTQKAVDA